jgi:spore maturation protein CgeB
MNILYLGDSGLYSTSFHRAAALRRLGHCVEVRDPNLAFRGDLSHRLWAVVHFRTGYAGLQQKVLRWAEHLAGEVPAPDLIWVNGGELFGPKVIDVLRRLGAPVVLYNNDDPTGARDGMRFYQVRRALSHYDVCVSLRPETAEEMKHMGARFVLREWFSYDEVAHAPFGERREIPENFRSEVAFVGTWMRHENRDHFLKRLVDAGVPVAIWGDRWQKAPHWKFLQDFWRGPSLGGRDYVAAIQGANICLGMLSKGNRDQHTQRSVEIPYAGGLLCGERTPEHLELYREGEDAVFWCDADECAAVCQRLLADEGERERIRRNGMQRVREVGAGNEDVCRRVLEHISLSA